MLMVYPGITLSGGSRSEWPLGALPLSRTVFRGGVAHHVAHAVPGPRPAAVGDGTRCQQAAHSVGSRILRPERTRRLAEKHAGLGVSASSCVSVPGLSA